MTSLPSTLHLRNGGTSAFLRVTETGIPQVLYWGADLGELSTQEADAFSRTQISAVVSGLSDIPPLLSLVPQQSEGWIGTPGLVGSRGGVAQFSSFTTQTIDQTPSSMIAHAHDEEANIDLSVELEVTDEGLVRTRATVTNTGDDGYDLDSLLIALPTPATETYVIDQSGHHQFAQ